jgi:hypothetical protein
LGCSGGIKATTGFQSQDYTNDEMVSIFKSALKREVKQFEYTQSRIRGAKDIFNKGGHVTNTYRDQKIRVIYDNRRSIIEPTETEYNDFDMSSRLYDSNPHSNTVVCSHNRFISKFAFKTPYLKSNPVRASAKTGYRSYSEVGVRNFIKGYLSSPPCFGLKGNEFKYYSDLISFVYCHYKTNEVKLSRQSISNLRSRQLILRPVPKTKENKSFAYYLKSKIEYFDVESFLKM